MDFNDGCDEDSNMSEKIKSAYKSEPHKSLFVEVPDTANNSRLWCYGNETT